MSRYNPKEVEPRWQKIWDETGVYTTNLDSSKPKYMAMSMFNYPSGNLHVGHAMNFTISDVKARFKRQQGFESYHPVGWDSFGLPAENYAIKAGISPQESMANLIPDYRAKYKSMGWSNDWEKEITTSSPEYYKWTQWLFVKMHQNRLAYQDSRWQWWCTKCQTVLANEQVIDGKCWRHDGKDDLIVEKKEVKQWFFKITDYADELLEATGDLDWTPSVKLAQENWIGRSQGAEIDFKIKDSDKQLKVYTTRADTLYGATFMVIAPEHDLAVELATEDKLADVEQYIKSSLKKTELERQSEKQKTGVFTGSYAINPVNNQEIPIYVADYVLSGYGTGAIMAVPAHDERDHDFAVKYDLPILTVINPVIVRSDAKDKPVDKKKQSIVALVVNDKNQVLTINWGPKFGGRLLVGGGQEDGETAEQTAVREVAEETGYSDLEVVEVGDETCFYKYYAFSKQQTHEIDAKFVLLKLKSDSRQQQNLDDSEKEKFKVEWVSRKQAEKEIIEPLHRYAYDKFIGGSVYGGEGVLTSSGEFDGLTNKQAAEQIVAKLAKNNQAELKTNYKMRDWSVSRQRYWGAPIPVINCQKCGSTVLEEADLPVVLPELTDFKPSGDGHSALARARDWLIVDCPKCGGQAERETDTLDTYVCSSWYMFRYIDPHNQEKAFETNKVNKWMPVDFYNGGDHATAHLLYARFINRFLHKIGLIDQAEPFKTMLYNGKVTAKDGSAFSKTLGNGPDPQTIIDSGYGADALRTYLMFAAPLEFGARWDEQGVPGTHRFLSRLWNVTHEYLGKDKTDLNESEASQLLQLTHKNIKKVTEDLEANRYNTAISSCMETLNNLYLLKEKIAFGKSDSWQTALESLIMCIAPFAPHISEQLWQDLGHSDSIHKDHWPEIDDKYLVSDKMTIVVQINGKLRASLEVDSDANKEQILELAKQHDNVKSHLEGASIKKDIYVPNKLVNFVV
jgi:leucyl-tRNA synthetase